MRASGKRNRFSLQPLMKGVKTSITMMPIRMMVKLCMIFLLLVAESYANPPQTPAMAHCQICWIRDGASEEPVADSSVFNGRTFYFCSESCKKEFDQDPNLWSIDPVATTDTSGFVTAVPT